ncbi:MAG: hypothetical protein PQJ46_16010 [Spirochaetales bacterium]|nr:hypothetical protein [Spirochaetales bacterium]
MSISFKSRIIIATVSITLLLSACVTTHSVSFADQKANEYLANYDGSSLRWEKNTSA